MFLPTQPPAFCPKGLHARAHVLRSDFFEVLNPPPGDSPQALDVRIQGVGCKFWVFVFVVLGFEFKYSGIDLSG